MIESRLSLPSSAWVFIGTPSTGKEVSEAVMPGRCAAPPAPAMITSRPRCSAVDAYWAVNCGVRWAERILTSCGTPNWFRMSLACRIVSQSDLLPIMTATNGRG